MMKWSKYLGLGLGILVIAWFIYKIGLVSILDTLTKANIYFILIALIFSLANIYAKLVRWEVQCRFNHLKIPFIETVNLVMPAFFIASLTPMKGGDIYRAHLMKHRYDFSMTKCITMIFSERFIEFVQLILFAAIGFSFFPMFKKYQVTVLSLTTIGLIVMLGFFLKSPKLVKHFDWLITRTPYVKKYTAAQISKKLDESIKKNLKKKPLILITIITFIALAFEVARTYSVALAFGYKLNPLIIASVFAISMLLGLLSFIPLGLGLTEVSMGTLLVILGIPVSTSASIVLIDRFISIWLVMLIGAFLYRWK